MWEIFDTGCSSAEENMRKDAELLLNLEQFDRPILHLYEWEGLSATYGYFTKPEQFLDLKKVQEQKLSLAKRPTGGGIVFHIWDFAFSILVPEKSPLFSNNTLANYALVNNIVLNVTQEFCGGELNAEIIPDDALAFDPNCKRFCMAQPTKYDVVWKGQKIAGAAQRQTKAGFLHQGTISIRKPDFALLEEVLLPGTRVLEAMRANTFTLIPQDASEQALEDARIKIKQLLTEHCVNYDYKNCDPTYA